MPSTGLHGPYNLNAATIDKVVGTALGAYALGYTKTDGTFIVEYVGRSDSDLNVRLKNWAAAGKHKVFKYGHFTTVKEAFEHECRMFHDFGGTASLQNDVHPARPANTTYRCPGGNCF